MGESAGERGGAQRTTLVEEGTAFKGTFASNCPIIVKGRIEGDVTGPSLVVSATGSVAGTVKVGSIESDGELSGDYEADVVRLSGRVCDNTVIRAKSLEIKLSPEKGKMQVIFGECGLEVGDMPSKEEVLSQALSPAASPPPEAVINPDPMPMANAESAQPSEASNEKPERKNGARGKGGMNRPSEMPPPAE